MMDCTLRCSSKSLVNIAVAMSLAFTIPATVSFNCVVIAILALTPE